MHLENGQGSSGGGLIMLSANYGFVNLTPNYISFVCKKQIHFFIIFKLDANNYGKSIFLKGTRFSEAK